MSHDQKDQRRFYTALLVFVMLLVVGCSLLFTVAIESKQARMDFTYSCEGLNTETCLRESPIK